MFASGPQPLLRIGQQVHDLYTGAFVRSIGQAIGCGPVLESPTGVSAYGSEVVVASQDAVCLLRLGRVMPLDELERRCRIERSALITIVNMCSVCSLPRREGKLCEGNDSAMQSAILMISFRSSFILRSPDALDGMIDAFERRIELLESEEEQREMIMVLQELEELRLHLVEEELRGDNARLTVEVRCSVSIVALNRAHEQNGWRVLLQCKLVQTRRTCTSWTQICQGTQSNRAQTPRDTSRPLLQTLFLL